MLSDYEGFEWSVGRPYLSKGEWQYDGHQRHSLFRHPKGLVEIDEYLGAKPVVAMRLIHNGICYSRRWEATWGDKTLARLAREMIEEIAA